jgi:anti-anti-sigma regulatory factor
MLQFATHDEILVAQPYGVLDSDSESDFFDALAPIEAGAVTDVTIDLRHLARFDDEATFVVAKVVTRLRDSGVSVAVVDHDGRWNYRARG